MPKDGLRSETKARPVAFLKKSYRSFRERVNFRRELRPSDVFLVGHPKSGNTWLALMLASLLEKEHGKSITLANVREIIPGMHAKDKRIREFASLPDPRIFRNEGPIYPDLYPKTIYLFRDPRAVYVSYYHHCLHVTCEDGWSIEDFLEEMLTYGCIRRLEPFIVRWDRQISFWRKRADKQPVKFVKYEEMKEDREKVLREVIGFIGMTSTEEEIARAVERGSFDSMRKEEEVHGAEPYGGTKGERGFYMRRGKTDGWKEEMPEACQKRLAEEFSAVMKSVGYV